MTAGGSTITWSIFLRRSFYSQETGAWVADPYRNCYLPAIPPAPTTLAFGLAPFIRFGEPTVRFAAVTAGP
jgi:hypothetical protein